MKDYQLRKLYAKVMRNHKRWCQASRLVSSQRYGNADEWDSAEGRAQAWGERTEQVRHEWLFACEQRTIKQLHLKQ